MKKLLNLQSSFSNIDTSWTDKTPIISTETDRMVTNLSKIFLQIQLIFIVSNQKQMIFVFRRTWSLEKKLLIYKSSSNNFPQNKKAISNYIYLLQLSVISFHSSLWYQLIGTNRNPCVAGNLQRPIVYSNDTSTLLLTLELSYKTLGIFYLEGN